jgi:hypothetical protein
MVSRPLTGDVVLAVAVAVVTATAGGVVGAHHGQPLGPAG